MKRTLRSVLILTLGMYFPAMAATYTVTTTSDSGPGSLRQAITDANLNTGPDNIHFNIPNTDPNYHPVTGVCIITLADDLPEITDPVTIDGLTQPGAAAGNLMAGTPHTLKIEIQGTDINGTYNGFHITSDGCTLRGLAINRINSYCISFNGTDFNTVQTCYFGLDAAGLWADKNTNYGNGIYLEACGTTLIGGGGNGNGNVIAGTYQEAILADDDGTPSNGCQNLTIQGNIIGWDVTGQGGNENFACNRAIDLDNTSQVLIGGTTLQEKNVIANCGDNVTFNYGDNVPSSTPCDNITIRGNILGADITGTLAGFGPVNDKGIQMNTCTTVTINDNLISGNRYQQLYGEYCSGLTMAGNKVGTDISGMSSLTPAGYSSDKEGLYFDHLSNSSIGPDNLISGATRNFGIVLTGSSACTIRGNKIGTDILGNPVLGNAYGGIDLDYSNNITIGGRTAGDGNIIAGNKDHGVYLWYDSGNGYNNLIAGNSIFDNEGLGISLGGGRSVNDNSDPDNGANRLQNFPVITGVVHAGSNTDITATLNSTPGTSFTIDFYWSPNIYFWDGEYICTGQGKVFLGSTTATTDGSGNTGLISFTATGQIPDGWYVTATATDPSNNTSEFSDPYMFGGAENVFVVISTDDSEVCGSLRQAILDANAHPGPDIIRFNIPVSDPGYVASGDYWSIQPGSGLPNITEAVVIDGYTQTGAQPNTTCMPATTDAQLKIEISGINDGGMSYGFYLYDAVDGVDNCTIRGLAINHWHHGGIGAFGLTNSNFEGNYIGTDITGSISPGGQFQGIYLSSGCSSITIGGGTAEKRNVISGNINNGVYLDWDISNITIQGNYIGTDKTGTVALGNGDNGIYLYGDNDFNLIGGTSACSRNIISGNGTISGNESCGIFGEYGDYNDNTIIGNYIGTGVTGTEILGNAHNGIFIKQEINNNVIGGTAAGEGNIITHNGWAGINLREEYTGNVSICNQISGNSIYDNGMLGIDLDEDSDNNDEPDGVTTNDVNDPDAGVNNYQNFPVLTTAVSNISSYTTITGTINTVSNAEVIVEFFASPGVDPTGYGEGRTYLGSTTVTTDGSGDAPISIELPVGVPSGSYISTTATLHSGDCYSTSEFSNGIMATTIPDTVCMAETNYVVEVYRDPEVIAYHWSISPAGPVLTTYTAPNDHRVSINWATGTPGTLYTLTVQAENECGLSDPSIREFKLLECDFGDAPDNQLAAQYPTIMMHNGASHGIVPTVYLGVVLPDAENDGQPSADAGYTNTTNNGDDYSGSPDDEEGVTIPQYLIPGQTQSITVVVNGAGGKLTGWIDWYADGDWADAGEQIAADVTDNGAGDGDPSTGTIQIAVNVPSDAVPGYSFARFRWSLKPNLTYNGFARTGEVEDYLVEIANFPILLTTKTGPSTGNVGDLITYTITVQHDPSSDGSPVLMTGVTDNLAGAATFIDDGTGDDDLYLDAGETWTYTVSRTILATDPDPLVNVATASGTDGDGDTIEDSDDHSLNTGYSPVLLTTKTGPSTGNVGDLIT
ncbi:MAG TPA: right-handed parallel beta-helix repeat-containing protein, partial [Bacteroidales bacterium]|nr:right-handed parallel beta-helix repeat-containing protein [Bacteroidales bacterium]